MNKTIPLLCVFAFNAFAQCARIEHNLYYIPDNTFSTDQTPVECVVPDKPDYFAQVSAGNDFSAAHNSENSIGPDVSSIHTALLARFSSLCETVMAKQRAALFNLQPGILISHVKTPPGNSSEDVPLSIG
jgi:hypothetical protein